MEGALSAILMTIGAVFVFVSAVGVLRMPDLYMRMSSAAKASTLGVGSLLAGAAVHFDDLAVASRATAIILFLLSTAPVAAHMIGRAAYLRGVPLWDRTVVDELRGSRDAESARPSRPARGTEGLRRRRRPRSGRRWRSRARRGFR